MSRTSCMKHQHAPIWKKTKRADGNFGDGSVTADYNVIGVRPSSRPRAQRAAVVPMRPIPLGLARVPALLRPRTGALRRGDPPPSLTQYFSFRIRLVNRARSGYVGVVWN